jgi:hypothetical protein
MTDPTSGDRRLLGYVAGGSLMIIALIAAGVIFRTVDKEAMGLLGVIVGGLLVNGKDTIGAIKERWLGQQVSRLGDQLSNSAPTPDKVTTTTVEGTDDARQP